MSIRNGSPWFVRRAIAIVSVLAAFVGGGCGTLFPNGSSGSGISVFITPLKFTSITAGHAPVTLAAQTLGDSTNSGVIWTLTANGAPCSTDCGFLSAITPFSATYTPPAVAPASPENAPKITATAVADGTRSDSASVSITASITVTITNKLNALPGGAIASSYRFTASTQNDPTNSGVSWGLSTTGGATCQPATCGTIVPGATPVTAIYQPPASAQASPVTITATSIHNGLVSDSDTFAVIASGNAPSSCNGVPTGKESLLKGSYAFFAQGTSVMAASFAADGTGRIKDLGGGVGGEMDLNAGNNPQHLTVIPTAANSTSLYTVGPDGTGAGSVGCLSLYTSNGATMIFRFALGKVIAGVATEGRITEFDDQFDPSSNAGTRASGPLRLQNPAAFASGNTSLLQTNYAFGMGGSGGGGDPHAVVVGALVLDPTTGVISNSDFDSDDLNAALAQSDVQGSIGSIGSISSKTGRAVFTFTPTSPAVWPGSLNATQAALYVVNSNELFLVSVDPIPSSVVSGSTPVLYAGRAIATGNAFSSTSLSSGNFILHETGVLAPGACSQCADVSLGLLTFASSNLSVSGKVFEYSAKNGATTTPFLGSATYAVSSKFGRVTLSGTGITHPPVFYLAQPTVSTDPTISTEPIYAFVGGTDPRASAASGLLEPGASANVTTATLGGKSYFFGDEDDPDDPTINNRVGVLSISSTGGIAGTQFTSGPAAPNLLSFGPVGISGVSIDNANGPGTGNVGANTVAITDGAKLFFIDEVSGTPASITVVEPQ